MLPEILSAGGQVLSQVGNMISQNKTNARAEAFALKMYDKQRRDSLTDWNMQNAYNDPAAQMKRLTAAGLNPHLVYGNGADAQMGAPVRSSSVSQPSFKAPQMDFGSVLQSALATQQTQANIARTNAETNRINQDTIYKKFENDVREQVGIDKYRANASDKLDLQDSNMKKSQLEFEAWNYIIGSTPVTNQSNPLAKKIASDFEMATTKLDIFKKDLDIKKSISVVKDFEAELAKAKISPNSPWYVKFVDALINKITGSSVVDLLK